MDDKDFRGLKEQSWGMYNDGVGGCILKGRKHRRVKQWKRTFEGRYT